MGELIKNMNTSRVSPGGLKGFMYRVNFLLDRMAISNRLGKGFGGKRDLYDAFGYDRLLSGETMWEMYYRGGIAQAIAHAYPNAAWARPPQLYIKGNKAFNDGMDKFIRKTKLWNMMRRFDIMTSMGRFGVLVIGTNKARMESPLPKGAKITYLQPYADRQITVARWNADVTSPRFGQPELYNIQPIRPSQNIAGDTVGATPIQAAFRVHWTRVIHACRDPLDNDIYGTPIYSAIWNYLNDLIKVVGSASESYWLQAFPGLHANVDKEIDLDKDDEANLQAEVEEYMHGIRRFIRTRGVEVDAIDSKIADPSKAFDVLLTLISGSTRIPKRILLGSESNQSSSSEDRGNWAERLIEYRRDHCEPQFIMPLLERIAEFGIDIGVGEFAPEDVQLLWPEAYLMSPLEKAQQSAQMARTLANVAKALAPSVSPSGNFTNDRNGGIQGGGNDAASGTSDASGGSSSGSGNSNTSGSDSGGGNSGAVAVPNTPTQGSEPLITREEARRLLGLSTDQQILIERPDE